MTHQFARWGVVFAVSGALTFSCAQVESTGNGGGSGGSDSSGDGDGSGGRVSTASGGVSGSSGGASNASGGGKTDPGGASSSGGSNDGGAPPVCEKGAEEACSEHSDEYPNGMAVCEGDGWDLSGCMFCTPDEEVSCALLDQATPDGKVVCDEKGLGWVEEPMDVCSACDESGPAADCDSPMNPTDNRGGMASCSAEGSYDWSECALCDGDVTPPSCSTATMGARPVGDVFCDGGTLWNTVDCIECDPMAYDVTIDCRDILDPAEDYTGGVASCGLDATWDESTCEYCGDGVKNGDEQCEGTVPGGLTCEDVGFTGDDSVIDTCGSDCRYDLSLCSLCDLDHQAKCLGEGMSADCNNSAECSGAQCGTTVECDMACSWKEDCTDLSCNAGATCNIDCAGGGALCEVDCKPDSNCNLSSTNAWEGDISGVFNCAKDGDCSYSFAVGPGGDVDAVINCEAGSTCEIISEQYQQDIGVVHCEKGADCTFTAESDKASTFTMECDEGATCSACPTNSTCNCTGAGCP